MGIDINDKCHVLFVKTTGYYTHKALQSAAMTTVVLQYEERRTTY
jgi:hypothetical protein